MLTRCSRAGVDVKEEQAAAGVLEHAMDMNKGVVWAAGSFANGN